MKHQILKHRTISRFLLLAAATLTLNACSGQAAENSTPTDSESSTDETESLTEVEICTDNTGGWDLNPADTTAVLPEDVQTAFDKAFAEQSGGYLQPLALLGSQIVAGTNYAILCQNSASPTEPVSELEVVIIYADLEGNAELLAESEFDPAVYAELDNDALSQEDLCGGWSWYLEQDAITLPEDAADALEKAAGELDGASYEPISYLGRQIVAGTNYSILCRQTCSDANATQALTVLTIYEDPDGNATISNCAFVDLASFNQ